MTARIAVIGGGISGLATAYGLASRGFSVSVHEADAVTGGLGAAFEYRNFTVEKFYHCLLPGDSALLNLLDSVGLGGAVQWRNVGMGFLNNHRMYAMNGALDLLRFAPLTYIERLRLGRFGLAARRARDTGLLDRTPVSEWIQQLAGGAVYSKLFKPLLEAKLGTAGPGIPALWLASRMQREKNNNTERKGFIPGGYRVITAAIEKALQRKGVEIYFSSRATSLSLRDGGVDVGFASGGSECYDRVVVTSPFVEFQRLAAGLPVHPSLAQLKLDYQGVVNCVFFLKKPLTKYYWLPIVDCGVVSQGLVELSNLVPTTHTGGLHVAYLLNYVHRESDLYKKTDSELSGIYRKDLATLFPGARDSVEAQFVFKAPYVEPIWPLSYGAMRPPVTAVPGRVYVASTAHVYPNVNAWNSCCEVAQEVVQACERDPHASNVAGVRP